MRKIAHAPRQSCSSRSRRRSGGSDALLRRPLARSTSVATIVFGEHLVLVAAHAAADPGGARRDVAARLADVSPRRSRSAPAPSAVATILFTQAFVDGDPVTPVGAPEGAAGRRGGRALVLLGERPRQRFACYFVPALVGTWLMAFPHPTSIGSDSTLLADALCARRGGALGRSGPCSGATSRATCRFEHVTTLRFTFGLPASAIALLVLGAPAFASAHDSFWIAVLALVTGAVAMSLYYYGLRTTPAVAATLAELAFPVTAVLVGYFKFGATLTADAVGRGRSHEPRRRAPAGASARHGRAARRPLQCRRDHDLRRRAARRAAERARRRSRRRSAPNSSSRLAAARAAAHRGGLVRARRPRAADGGRRGGRRRGRPRGAELSGLVLNERGYERFAADRRSHASTARSPRPRRSTGETATPRSTKRSSACARSSRPPTCRSTVTVSCAWGCPFEGEVDPAVVADLCERLEGADELVLADTIGVATPRRVRRLVERVSILGKPVGAHLHNTRNTGYAAAWAALEGGATVLDASVGGLGGCPFSPNATGNIATEDLVWQLERDGVATGVDLDALVAISRWLEGVLGRRARGHALPRCELARVGRERPVDVVVGRLPVRDRDADRGAPVPRRAAHPRLAARPAPRASGVVGLVVGREAEEHLVQLDVVQHLRAELLEAGGESPRVRAAALDHLGDAVRPSERIAA